MIDDAPKKEAIKRLTVRLMKDRHHPGKGLSLTEWESLLDEEFEKIYDLGFYNGMQAIPPH